MKLYLRIFLFILITAYWLCCQCGHEQKNTSSEETNQNRTDTLQNKYAKGFQIIKHEHFTELCVFNPFQGAENIRYRYFLVEKNEKRSSENSLISYIETPVERIVCLSTTHIALIDLIGEAQTILGVSGVDYVCNSTVQKRIEAGKVADVGYDQNLNYEMLISLKPDIVMAYGVGANSMGFINKLEELNIPVVMNAEYLETDPLAKAEWVKFVAAFYDKDSLALAKFSQIEKKYLKHKNHIAGFINEKAKPTVITGLPWKDSWYVPGGNSYLAHLIRDAGGKYIWNDNQKRESIPLSIETVFSKAKNADIWINTDAARSKNDILTIDARLEQFKAFENNKTYNCNAILNQKGGNDYWETGIIEPHIILKDVASIFHPDLFPNHELVYYKKLSDYE